MSDVLYDLHATHTRPGPVFVIGDARSGTSLTCRLLRRYLKVSFGTESQFILRYLQRLPRYGDLRQDDNLRRLIGDIGRERFFERTFLNWRFVFDPEKAVADTVERSYAGVLNAIFLQLARHNRMVRWGDKTPQYNHDLAALDRLFPTAQFVHVVRDGRDVAVSLSQTAFGAKNACEAALGWQRTLEAIGAFGARLPPDRYHVVRYEELTSQPADTLASLSRFLGIDDRDGQLDSYVREHVWQDVRGGNSNKWQTALAPREIERFEGIAGRTLRSLGYPLALDGTARPVTVSEMMFWRLYGRLTRMSMAGYWEDNLYKLRLRTRRVGRPLAMTGTAQDQRAHLTAHAGSLRNVPAPAIHSHDESPRVSAPGLPVVRLSTPDAFMTRISAPIRRRRLPATRQTVG